MFVRWAPAVFKIALSSVPHPPYVLACLNKSGTDRQPYKRTVKMKQILSLHVLFTFLRWSQLGFSTASGGTEAEPLLSLGTTKLGELDILPALTQIYLPKLLFFSFGHMSIGCCETSLSFCAFQMFTIWIFILLGSQPLPRLSLPPCVCSFSRVEWLSSWLLLM